MKKIIVPADFNFISRLFLPSASIGVIQVLELSRCSIADGDVAVLCKGLADARCRIRLVLLSNNVDLRDRGATGRLRNAFFFLDKYSVVDALTCAYDKWHPRHSYPLSRASSIYTPPPLFQLRLT